MASSTLIDTILPRCLTLAAALILHTCATHAQIYFADSSRLLPAMPENGMDVEVADIDHDGDPDVVVASEFQSNVLLLNDGHGRFLNVSKGRFSDARHDSEDIAVEDFDHDGDLDVIFVAEDDSTHEYYLNDGAGGFTDVGTRLPHSVANAVVARDLTGDGYIDLVIGNAGQDFLLVNDGTGSFIDQTPQRLPVEQHVTQDVELADVDGDGDLDIIDGNEDGNALLINRGLGYFSDETTARIDFPQTLETRKVTPADVDGDGDVDLFLANVAFRPGKDPRDRLYINDGTGHFSDRSEELLPASAQSSIDGKLGDLDGDGDLDLVTGSFPNEPVRIYLNDGHGKFTDAPIGMLPPGVVGAALGIEIADLNGDGLPDLYVCMRGTKDHLLLQRRSEGSSRVHDGAGGHHSDLLNIDRVQPTPCRDDVAIHYTLERQCSVRAVIYDERGREVERYDLGPVGPGAASFRWTAGDGPAGIYYCRLETEAGSTTASVVATAER